MFGPLPAKPDHNALELAILDIWAREGTFDQLRAQNADGPKFRFIDGPVTANKSLAVHTAWGRTLKDVFLRYKALNGYHQRYQNGFDCQGLWIEVGVEKQLGLNSKREIEEYGLAAFAAECRAVVEQSAAELTAGSIRLGQWMDWGNDYFTFSDTNIEYIWKFLQIVHERGWIFKGHRATEWCPRCGTSISAHELAGSYIDKDDPSRLRPPAAARPPRRGARHLDDDAVDAAGERRRGRQARPRLRPARQRRLGRRRHRLGRGVRRDEARRRARRVALRGPVRHADARLRGRPPGHPVGRHLDRGGHRRRAHRARLRRRGLRARQGARPADAHARRRDGPLLPGVRLARRAGHVRDGRRHPRRPHGPRPPRRRRHGPPPLPRVLALPHAADLPHLRRLVHLRRRHPRADARGQRRRRVDAGVHGQADGRLARQHGRLEHLPAPLLRPAAAVLPVLVVRPPDRHRVAPGAGRAGHRLARRAAGAAPAVDRRRPDRLRRVRPRGAAHPGGRRRVARRRHRAVLDARVGEPDVDRRWLRQRRRRRTDRRRPARPRLLGGVVPGRLGVGDARADPPVVLLAAVHVRRPHRSGAVPQGARLREDARRDRPRDARLVGQPDRRPGGVRADGRRRDALAVLPAAAVAGPAVRLQAGLRDPAQGADAVEQRRLLHAVRRRRRLHAVVRRPRRRPARARTGWTSGPAPSPTASSPPRPTATRAT